MKTEKEIMATKRFERYYQKATEQYNRVKLHVSDASAEKRLDRRFQKLTEQYNRVMTKS